MDNFDDFDPRRDERSYTDSCWYMSDAKTDGPPFALIEACMKTRGALRANYQAVDARWKA
ncbi:hypothetical protein ACFOLC_13585 [Lysobacter cavernae]|uniref:Uncharacterized protein n=1 Tax=Lysobacter cavernae TaxID=1685901 RepID=A0ABV7RTN5_9GAMM